MSTSPNAMARWDKVCPDWELFFIENNIFRFTSEQRDCYSEDEISLKFLPKDHGYR